MTISRDGSLFFPVCGPCVGSYSSFGSCRLVFDQFERGQKGAPRWSGEWLHRGLTVRDGKTLLQCSDPSNGATVTTLSGGGTFPRGCGGAVENHQAAACLFTIVGTSAPAESRARSSEAMQITKHKTLISSRFRCERRVARNSLVAMLKCANPPHNNANQPR